jgi:hypothetical protein
MLALAVVVRLALVGALGVMAGRRTPRERFWAAAAVETAWLLLRSEGGALTEEDVYTRAKQVLDQQHPNHGITHVGAFLRRWGSRAATHGHLGDAHRSGRAQRMTDAECAECIRHIRAGRLTAAGQFTPYPNLTDAKNKNPVLRSYAALYKSIEGFEQRLLRFEPYAL